MAPGKFIPEKLGILGGWETGETEATVQVARNPWRGMSVSQPPPPYRPDPAKLQLGLGTSTRVEVRMWSKME